MILLTIRLQLRREPQWHGDLFKLLIKHPDADTVTITDTLPKGLKYVEAKNTDNTLNWQDSYRVGTTKYDRNGIAESDLWANQPTQHRRIPVDDFHE